MNSKYNLPPNAYCVGNADGEKGGVNLGLIDFSVYNILLLLTVSSFMPITIKILVALGCIISVQVGSFATDLIFGKLWKINGQPAVPLPVITVSIYLFVLNSITTSSHGCG